MKEASTRFRRPLTVTRVRVSKSDVVMSIKDEHMKLILDRSKDHEFRKYMMSNKVQRVWIYIPTPDQTLRYIAVISHAKLPGEIEFEYGEGNSEFNAGLRQDVATHAYEIKELYQLRVPIPLHVMQMTYGVTFPQRYSYIPETMMQDFPLKDQIQLF